MLLSCLAAVLEASAALSLRPRLVRRRRRGVAVLKSPQRFWLRRVDSVYTPLRYAAI